MRSSFEELAWPARGEFVPARPEPDAGANEPGAGGTESGDAAQAALRAELATLRAELRDELEAESRARVESAVAALTDAARAQQRLAAEETVALRSGIVELGLAIAERLVRRRVECEPEILADLVGEALERLASREPISVALASADFERLGADGAPGLAALAERWGARFEADPSLACGEARVEAGDASVDLRVASLLERFREDLLERVPTLAGESS